MLFHAQAQNSIKGYAYEDEYRTPMPGVSVYTTSGNRTITDSSGYFSIKIKGKDSLYFSYKIRTTHKFPIDTIRDPNNFEIAIHLNVLARKNTPPGYLPDVTVYSNSYYMDSLNNRKEYDKVFNFKKPGLSDIASVPKIGNIPIPLGVYLNPEAIIESFQFRKNRRRETYRDFALWLEQEKYIDHRFTKRRVESITHLRENNLENFMRNYRPAFLELITMNDVELNVYIKKCFEDTNRKKSPPTFLEKLRAGGISSVREE